MKKILVTGGAGFVGSNLASRFKGEEVTILDNFSRGKKEYLDYLGVDPIIERVDLRDFDSTYEALSNANPDIIFHCACKIGGMQFLHGSPEREFNVLMDNLAIDRNVFDSCYRLNIRNIVYTSSISVYNTSVQYEKETLFKENEVDLPFTDPEGGYGLSKYTGEKTLSYLSKAGFKIGIARIFKSYGPCDDYSPESGQVVCSLMRKILNKEPYHIWGTGKVKRCLLYIDDLLDALVMLSNHPRSLTVNIGAKKGTSIKELAYKIKEISGEDIDIFFDKSKPEGPRSRVPDLSLAKKELGWEPLVDLDTGLQKTWDWMEKEFE